MAYWLEICDLRCSLLSVLLRSPLTIPTRSSLISAFPDGIMLDYDIQEEDPAGEKVRPYGEEPHRPAVPLVIVRGVTDVPLFAVR